MNNGLNENAKIVLPLSEMEDVIKETVSGGGKFSLITAGVSMMPLLRNRKDTVVLTKAVFPLGLYDIPLYKRNDGKFVLHRIIGFEKDSYVMCGDNQLFAEKGIKDDNIIAVVETIIRNGKKIDLKKSKGYKIYLFFWCRLFFIRKICLKSFTVIRKIRKLFIKK